MHIQNCYRWDCLNVCVRMVLRLLSIQFMFSSIRNKLCVLFDTHFFGFAWNLNCGFELNQIPISNYYEIQRVRGISIPKYLDFDFKLIIQFQFSIFHLESSSYWNFNLDLGKPDILGVVRIRIFCYHEIKKNMASYQKILFHVKHFMTFWSQRSFDVRCSSPKVHLKADTSVGNHLFDQSIITFYIGP